MADQFVAPPSEDPSVEAWWTAQGYSAPANLASWPVNPHDTLTAGYAALGTGGSDVLHVAPGSYAEDFAFSTSTKPYMTVYGEVIIAGAGGAGRPLTIQNTGKTVNGGLGDDSSGNSIDRLVISGATNTGNLVRQQGTGSLTVNTDFEFKDINQSSALGHWFDCSAATNISLTVNGRMFVRTEAHTTSGARTYTANCVAFNNPTGTVTGTILWSFNGGIFVNADIERIFDLQFSNVAATPSKVEIIGGQCTGRARFFARLNHANWNMAAGNQFIMRGVKFLPSEWEFGSRVSTAVDNIIELIAGADYRAEACILNNAPFYNGITPAGEDASSKYNTKSLQSYRIRPRRGKVSISLQTDDFYDTFNHLITNTIDSRVKATMGLAYTTNAALIKRQATQNYTDFVTAHSITASVGELSIPGSSLGGTATSWADADIVSNFITPTLAHIANGHEIVTHSRTHSQLGYAPAFTVNLTGTTMAIANNTLTLAGGITASFDLTAYVEMGDLIHALHAAHPTLQTTVVRNVSGAASQVGDFAGQPITLADFAATDCLGLTVSRDWSRVYTYDVLGSLTDIATIGFPTPTSFIYPVGFMSDELIALMEAGDLLGGRQVYPANSGITVNGITSPFWRPLDEGWEPFRQGCVNVESQYTGANTTKLEVMESVRRYIEWHKWHGGFLCFYGHGLTTMTVSGIVRWDWIIEACKEYVDAGEAEYVTFSAGLRKMRTRNSATISATGRGNNDKFVYTFTDQRAALDFSSSTGNNGRLLI